MKTKIFIDPGHGGPDTGAAANGIMEKDLNLMVARELVMLLNQEYYNIMLSRSTDAEVTLKDRTDKANNWGADLYVSIHHNGFNNPAASGYEVYYQLYRPLLKDDSFRLAYLVNAEFGNTFFPAIISRGLKHREGNIRGREWFHVLRETICPAIITECGFITSPVDIVTLKDKTFPIRQAQSIRKALDLYNSSHYDNLAKDNFFYELKNLVNKYQGIF